MKLFISICRVLFLASGVLAGAVCYGQASDSTANDLYFWIGDTGPAGPVVSGPHQYPFICTTVENGLGQPRVDNQAGVGNAVFPEIKGVPDYNAEPVGYSAQCGLATRVEYFYYSTNSRKFVKLPAPTEVPPDVAIIKPDGKPMKFVVRLERGTINRFIYSVAMLAPFAESLARPDTLDNSAWNRRLVYKFQGGVGMGRWQGGFGLGKHDALYYEALERGYAVAYSTGNRTGTHYNLTLAQETAFMVKGHFVAVYGQPEYTVGIGGSGGAVQQYVLGQNSHQIIDAAIAQMSYPDMVTQTIYVADCELLERYFDEEYSRNPASRWGRWTERSLIEGMAANNLVYKMPWSLSPHAPSPGSSECVNGWRGQVPALFNPRWTYPQYQTALDLYRYPPQLAASTQWTYWNDLGNIYPQDEQGIAPNSWDNVGVQYGLRALLSGAIDQQEFLEINACVGGWKAPQDMAIGSYPWRFDADPSIVDPWDKFNMNLSASCRSGQPAARTAGSIQAMRAAYASGQVFLGNLTIPVIDVRWYLDPVLDLHHALGSFSARARITNFLGHADNQLIWVVACSHLDVAHGKKKCDYNPSGEALDLVAQWLHGKAANGVRVNPVDKPPTATDRCYAADGAILYAGAKVWNGILDDKPAGSCTKEFPVYATARIVAGDSMRGDVFKCALQSIDDAIARGVYGGVRFDSRQLAWLAKIFPTGVCDYQKPDQGKPAEVLLGSRHTPAPAPGDQETARK